jgi:hypothetical protein
MALVKYNNNSISAVTAAASIPSGSLVHIKTLTASSSATLSFVHGTDGVVLDSTYPIYKFEFINCHPATDLANFLFQGSTNSGSAYGVTITSTAFIAYNREDNSTAALGYQANGDLAQSTSFQNITKEIGNGSDESMSGSLSIFNPSSTTFVKHWINESHHMDGTGSPLAVRDMMAGYFNTTSAINAFQFKMSSGNIDSGKIKLYGIKDS